MVASSFTSVSMAPPLVSVAIQLTSTTWPLLAGRPALGLSVLGAHQGPVCRQLAAVGNDRFREVRWSASETGAVLIDGAVAWLTCATDQIIRTGNHDLVLLAVDAVAVNPGTPLVFHSSSFRRLEATRHRASDADVVQLLPAGDVEFDEAMHPGGRSGVVQLMPAGDAELQEQ
jgi:flavin reductase (DIM6/NTAB) family NADH-FMN oxidoreductase RutF